MRRFLLLCVFVSVPFASFAHEFWIEPEQYQVDPGEDIIAHLRVGEDFEGSPYSFNPRTFSRFDFAHAGSVLSVPGRPGDRPAVQMPAPEDGLLILVHETNALRLTYRSMEKFENFLRHKDWLALLDAHRARGLSEDRFQERYTRHVKSLVAIGSGVGADRAMGLETEIVALSNPYTDVTDSLSVQVLLSGEPRGDVQVELFEKTADGVVNVTLHRTDANGVAALPVASGASYLVDAVVVRAIDPSVTDPAVWESLWAGLTFAVP